MNIRSFPERYTHPRGCVITIRMFYTFGYYITENTYLLGKVQIITPWNDNIPFHIHYTCRDSSSIYLSCGSAQCNNDNNKLKNICVLRGLYRDRRLTGCIFYTQYFYVSN